MIRHYLGQHIIITNHKTNWKTCFYFVAFVTFWRLFDIANRWNVSKWNYDTVTIKFIFLYIVVLVLLRSDTCIPAESYLASIVIPSFIVIIVVGYCIFAKLKYFIWNTFMRKRIFVFLYLYYFIVQQYDILNDIILLYGLVFYET